VRALSDDAVWRLSVPSSVCLSDLNLAQRLAHVTRDSDITFKVKRSKVDVTGSGSILWRPPAYSSFFITPKRQHSNTVIHSNIDPIVATRSAFAMSESFAPSIVKYLNTQVFKYRLNTANLTDRLQSVLNAACSIGLLQADSAKSFTPSNRPMCTVINDSAYFSPADCWTQWSSI